ncbi:hypothetical protein Ddye_015134 [Dipteronia dyeriana]|uniref:ABC transporter domain-containing protein n=1 Tax=Dipteronia dyeriana TaxID=168575 RepID=A0AAD9U4A3_9ROSI|nr:hypothetical protein Ddye_015134 [Dipteronia dyeriana]
MIVVSINGSRKSTLIDALAGRIEKESLKETVTLNGEVLESRVLKTISAYVMENDHLFPMLTVEEMLMFLAEFRLPRSISKQRKQARVQALIDQLGLRSVANIVIGDERHRGVSGRERRRVSIGVDIIHDPILLFLDEPTSGLDSTSAFMVVKEFGHPIPENENLIEFALDLIRKFEESSDQITSLVEFNMSWMLTMKNPYNKLYDKPNISLEDAIKASISKGKIVTAVNTTSDSN